MFSNIQKGILHLHFTFQIHPCPRGSLFQIHPCPSISNFAHFNFKFLIDRRKMQPSGIFSKFHPHNYPSIWPPLPHPLIFRFFTYHTTLVKTSMCLITDTRVHDWSIKWGLAVDRLLSMYIVFYSSWKIINTIMFCLVPNQSENGKYNLILDRFNMMRKIFRILTKGSL